MEKHVLFGFFALCLASTVICKLGAPGGPMKLHRDSPDGFKTMEKFEHALAISDSDNDTVFECMTSTRVDINPETMTATYAISLPKPGNVLLFQITPGSSPGRLIFKSDLECTLWVRVAVKNNIPQDCMDQFVDVCGVIVPENSQDMCADMDDVN
ncbi:uncharacterized protein LOC119178416 isoform X2 [Rhipicephalus microplus]|uniref:uncharacterized protein LOC119178416 isoform X2 n=1 Tax=Rhipicephalus microplus TaxID=6941 RepID=UPI003F6B839A